MSAEPNPGGRPLHDSEKASSQIQLRVTPSRKGIYTRVSRAKGLTLAAWIFALCDRESGYVPKQEGKEG